MSLSELEAEFANELSNPKGLKCIMVDGEVMKTGKDNVKSIHFVAASDTFVTFKVVFEETRLTNSFMMVPVSKLISFFPYDD